jgi:hypothetical protein
MSIRTRVFWRSSDIRSTDRLSAGRNYVTLAAISLAAKKRNVDIKARKNVFIRGEALTGVLNVVRCQVSYGRLTGESNPELDNSSVIDSL